MDRHERAVARERVAGWIPQDLVRQLVEDLEADNRRLRAACEEVIDELRYGEASEGDLRRIHWCAVTLGAVALAPAAAGGEGGDGT